MEFESKKNKEDIGKLLFITAIQQHQQILGKLCDIVHLINTSCSEPSTEKKRNTLSAVNNDKNSRKRTYEEVSSASLSPVVKQQLTQFVKHWRCIPRDPASREPFMLWQRFIVVAAGLTVDQELSTNSGGNDRGSRILSAAQRIAEELFSDEDIARHVLPPKYTQEDLLMACKPQRFVPQSRRARGPNRPLEAKDVLERYRRYCEEVRDLCAQWNTLVRQGMRVSSVEDVEDVLHVLLEQQRQQRGEDDARKVRIPHAWIAFVVFGPPAGENAALKFAPPLHSVEDDSNGAVPRTVEVMDSSPDEDDALSFSSVTFEEKSTSSIDGLKKPVFEAFNAVRSNPLAEYNKQANFDRLQSALREVIDHCDESEMRKRARALRMKVNMTFIQSQCERGGWLEGEDPHFFHDL